MGIADAIPAIQAGGTVVCLILAVWLVGTRRVITRGEFDLLNEQYNEVKKLNAEANAELLKQSTTNARLVELAFSQRDEAERIRRKPGEDKDYA
jgi:hypothetical protein